MTALLLTQVTCASTNTPPVLSQVQNDIDGEAANLWDIRSR